MQSPSLPNVFTQVLVANAVVQTTATPRNLMSFILSPGTWKLDILVHWIFAATTNYTLLQAGINTVTATMPTADNGLYELPAAAAGIVPVQPIDMYFCGLPLVVPVSTTYFLNTTAIFTAAALTLSGFVNAVQLSS